MFESGKVYCDGHGVQWIIIRIDEGSPFPVVAGNLDGNIKRYTTAGVFQKTRDLNNLVFE